MNLRRAVSIRSVPVRGPLAAASEPGVRLPPPLRPGARLGVLDVTKYFGDTSGGIRTYLLQKARYVAVRPDLRQVMVIPGSADQVQTGNGSRIYRLRGPRMPLNPPYRFLLATASFQRIVEHERPDLIEVGSPFLVPWLTRFANRRHEAPTVWFYHRHFPELVAAEAARDGLVRRTASAVVSRYVRLLGDRFPAVVCSSLYSASELQLLGVPRVAVAPLGVDLVRFRPERREWAAETRKAFGLPEGRVALFGGRFAAEKRLDVVLDAWPEVERRTRIRLALIGAGPAFDRLRRHHYAPRVHWLPFAGDRDRFADLVAACDLYVAPGPFETFGLSVLEALASGTPVLSTDEGGGAELVRASRAGELYRTGDPGHLADAAAWLARQNLSYLGHRGRRYAETHHDWDGALDRLFEIYGRVRDQGA